MDTQTETVIGFIVARLDEDEKRARKCDGDATVEFIGDQMIEDGARSEGKHIRRHPPSRVLRQVGALRAILVEHETLNDTGRQEYCRACHFDRGYPGSPMPCATVRAVASIWSDHRDYPFRPPAPAAPVQAWATSGYLLGGPMSPPWMLS